jgi:hypothetical protein
LFDEFGLDGGGYRTAKLVALLVVTLNAGALCVHINDDIYAATA